MRIRRSCAVLLASLAGACAPMELVSEAVPAGPTTRLEDCELYYENVANDALVHRCAGFGGVPIWWRYADSARLYVGFGARPHDNGFFGIEQEPEPEFEWRGVERSTGFVPHAVIIRLSRPPGDALPSKPPAFTIFRLREDGTSCVIELEIATASQARRIADDAVDGFECIYEPNLYAGELGNNSH